MDDWTTIVAAAATLIIPATGALIGHVLHNVQQAKDRASIESFAQDLLRDGNGLTEEQKLRVRDVLSRIRSGQA